MMLHILAPLYVAAGFFFSLTGRGLFTRTFSIIGGGIIGKVVGIYVESEGGEIALPGLLRQKESLDRIIYIDDGVSSLIDMFGIDYQRSQKRLGFLHHLYTTVHQLEDEDMVILLNKEGAHLKSFCAGLFKKIHITQFLSNGVFAKEKITPFFMLPMLEICEE
jgi:hypothetical protein